MINQHALQGQWNDVRSKLRSRWDVLSDDDLSHFNGNVEGLLNQLHTKTGEARESIERFLEEALAGQGDATTDTLAAAGKVASDLKEKTVAAARDTYEQVSDQLRDGYESSQDMIREQPAQSVATAFGAGVITGFLLFLVLRPR